MSNRIRNNSRGYDYFFVSPNGKWNGSAHRAAKKLIGLKRVKEVSITEGYCGFVVKAEQSFEEEDEDLLRGEIAAAIGCSARKASCHYSYVKS